MTNSMIVSRNTFADHMAILSRITSSHPYLPILANVLLKKDKDQLQLSATDITMAVTIYMETKIEGDVNVTLPAKSLAAMTNSVDAKEIEFIFGDKPEVSLSCGSYKGLLKGQRANEFPEIPVFDVSSGWVIDARIFKDLMERVLFACGEDNNRPILTGAFLVMDETTLTLVAADGFRLARVTAEVEGIHEKRIVVIPASTLKEVVRIIGNNKAEHITVFFPTNKDQLVLQCDGAQIVTRLIDGQYPDYLQIIPKRHQTRTVINTQLLRNTIRQLSVISRNCSNAVRFHFIPDLTSGGKILIVAEADDTGCSRAETPCSITGQEVEIAFNSKYLLQGLEVVTTENVVLETNTHNTPVAIYPEGDDNFLYVLMPMHVGEK